jgi:hypothetical protein
MIMCPLLRKLGCIWLSPLFCGTKESKYLYHSVPLGANSKNVWSFGYIPLLVWCSNAKIFTYSPSFG